eukprot:13511948-Alexandrium_andersonii.AAC.1
MSWDWTKATPIENAHAKAAYDVHDQLSIRFKTMIRAPGSMAKRLWERVESASKTVLDSEATKELVAKSVEALSAIKEQLGSSDSPAATNFCNLIAVPETKTTLSKGLTALESARISPQLHGACLNQLETLIACGTR